MMRDRASSATVLNVDDSEPTLYLRTHILRAAGFEVLEARSGREALKLAATCHPEVALLDINLPDITGIEVCSAIKSNPATASTLVIQISAKRIEAMDRLRGLESGADTYLVHPVDPDVLVATVEALLRLRGTLQETRRALQISHDFLTIANRHTDMAGLLAESAPRLGTLAGCASAGIWITEEDGSIVQGVSEGCCRELSDCSSGSLSEGRIREACGKLGCPAFVSVPIGIAGRHAGFIHLADKVELSPEIMQLVATAASHLGPAIERLRAEEALKRARDELEERVRDRTGELARANAELETERQRLFTILEELPSFVCLHGPDYSIRFANRRFREVFGEPAGRYCYEIIAQREAPCTDCPSVQVFATGMRLEREWTAPNGRHYQLYHHPFVQRDGPDLVMELGIDITERREMERALQIERNRLNEILDKLPDGICVINRRSELEYVNPALERDYGPATKGSSHEYFHGNRATCPLCQNGEMFQGRSLRSEWHSPRTDKTYEIYDTPIATADGSIGKLGIFHDISPRKKAEEALRRSENLLRNVLETLPVGVLIADRHGAIVSANPEAERIWGGVKFVRLEQYGEFRGRWADSREFIKPDQWALARAVTRGETSIGEEIEIECFDGNRRVILNSAVPVRGPDRSVLGAVVVNQDITERKRAESERARQQQRLEALWKISHMEDTNAGRLLRQMLTELLSMTGSSAGLYGTVSPDEKVFRLHSASSDLKGQAAGIELEIPISGVWRDALRLRKPQMTADGSDVYTSTGFPATGLKVERLLVVPVIDSGRPVALAVLANKEADYTAEDTEQAYAFLTGVHVLLQRRQAEDALRASEKELRILSGRILTAQETERSRISRELHDELGQALTLLKLRVGSLQKRLREDQPALKGECQTTLSYLDEVIESVRTLSRELSPSVLEDLGLVAGLRQLIHGFSERSGIRIQADLEAVDSMISKESHILIYRVVQEALTNVARHSGARRASVSLKSTPKCIECKIADNGQGMKSRPGRGLGLTIMKERVNMLGGALGISSREGKGTTIRFSIPVTKGPVDAKAKRRPRR
jgi:PAS domain S-box-containing protein